MKLGTGAVDIYPKIASALRIVPYDAVYRDILKKERK
jgi:hypothetical protein